MIKEEAGSKPGINYVLNHQYISTFNRSLKALTDKPSRRRVPVTIDYLGFTVPNKFLVGYGLDWDEKFRHLPYISFVEVED